MGSDGGAWAMDPATNYDTYFVPQGIGADLIATIEGFTPRGRRRLRRALAGSAPRRPGPSGYFAKSVVPVKDQNGLVVLDHDEHMRPGTTVESLGKLQPRLRRASARWAASTPWRCRSTTGSRRSTTSTPPATRSGIVDGAALVLVGTEEAGAARA